METQNDGFGISVVSVSPLGPLPEDAKAQLIYRVRMRIQALGQAAHFDLEIPAEGLDEAVQKAYSKWEFLLGALSILAKKANDNLLSRVKKIN